VKSAKTGAIHETVVSTTFLAVTHQNGMDAHRLTLFPQTQSYEINKELNECIQKAGKYNIGAKEAVKYTKFNSAKYIQSDTLLVKKEAQPQDTLRNIKYNSYNNN
jgi:hypothetical protein